MGIMTLEGSDSIKIGQIISLICNFLSSELWIHRELGINY